MRPIAVYTDVDDLDPEPGMRLLEEAGFDVRLLHTLDPVVIRREAADAEVLLVGYAPVDAETIAALPRLALISLLSAGSDHVDLDAASARGVWVSNLPSVATEEVSTHALALTLAVVRNMNFFQTAAAGDYWSRPERPPIRLSTARLGVLGLGRIGRRFIEMARPLFGAVSGYDPYIAEDDEALRALGVERSSLAEVVRTADVLSLHLPLTADTERLFGAEMLATMKPGSVIINVSRGGLVDSQALREALGSGHIGGAGLDVLDVEPPAADHPLLGHPAVVLTPHIAFLSQQTRTDYILCQARNATNWLTHGTPHTPVNAPARSLKAAQ